MGNLSLKHIIIPMKRGPIINFLIKNKLASNVKTANGILLVISILNFLITVELISKVYPSIMEELAYREYRLPANIEDSVQ